MVGIEADGIFQGATSSAKVPAHLQEDLPVQAPQFVEGGNSHARRHGLCQLRQVRIIQRSDRVEPGEVQELHGPGSEIKGLPQLLHISNLDVGNIVAVLVFGQDR